MSRFYKIKVSAETAVPAGQTAASGNAGAEWTNMVGGKADLGAQTIEFDIPVYSFDAPIGQAAVTIWGPTKAQISQASDFNGAHIDVYAGMQKGLPIASALAAQAGSILSGQIFQAFGNWQGINQTLNFVVLTDAGSTQSNPGNLAFLWKKGEKMGDVIKRTLAIAYPAFKIHVNIRDNLVLTQDEAGVYQTLQQFSSWVKGVSQDIIPTKYPGVSITLKDGTLNVQDDSADDSKKIVQITMQEMVGQVTWLGPNTVQFNTIMRSDIEGNSKIKLPPQAAARAVTTSSSYSNTRAKNTFDGTWTVTFIRHVGNSRAADAQSWISTFQAVSEDASASETSVANSSS